MKQSVYDALLHVADVARSYRKMEQEDTPRLWRGKKLHDLGLALDEALEAAHKAIQTDRTGP